MAGTVVPLQLLPEGLVVPPLPYVVALVVATAVVGAVALRERPPITDAVVVAAVPWMVLGGALHVVRQVGAAPASLGPLFDAPAVYLTTTLLAAVVWLGGRRLDPERATGWLGAVGWLLTLVPTALLLWIGVGRGTLALAWPGIGLGASVALTVLVYGVARRVRPSVVGTVGAAAPVVVFGHALDGVSTAIAVDLFGAGERSPLPRAIMDVAASLPTASVLGTGWLFVVVKLAIAVGIVAAFADFVEEAPSQANALLAVVAAVGLGPGAHNLFLFVVTAGA